MIQYLLYLDPGSGSYLVQVIVAAVLGVAFYFRSAWWKIKSFFTRSGKENANRKESVNE